MRRKRPWSCASEDRQIATESYDKLVLSPGAPSVHPSLPGIDLPGIFHVRTVPDARAIREWIERGDRLAEEQLCRHPVVGPGDSRGGGWRRLHRARDGGKSDPSRPRGDLGSRGFHVIGPLDPEIACLVEGHMQKHGLKLVLNDGVSGFKQLEAAPLKFRPAPVDSARRCGDSRHRCATRHNPLENPPGLRSASVAASSWTNRCAPAIRIFLRSAMRSRSGISSPGNSP